MRPKNGNLSGLLLLTEKADLPKDRFLPGLFFCLHLGMYNGRTLDRTRAVIGFFQLYDDPELMGAG